MNYLAPPNQPVNRKSSARGQASNRGVVLIVALILLVVISLLAVTSLRNAGSAESVAGNVRTTEMATQAAELALRYCETTLKDFNGSPPATSTLTVSIMTGAPLWSAKNTVTNAMTNWDVTPTTAIVLPLTLVNDPTLTVSYRRPPECMVEAQQVWQASGTSTASAWVITARGFGPEVPAANNSRTRPAGTEVWLQSTVQLLP